MECPRIEKEIEENKFNQKINYKDLGGNTDYIYWQHTDPGGVSSLVQFCKKIGRKKDVFECMNENEWKNCFHSG